MNLCKTIYLGWIISAFATLAFPLAAGAQDHGAGGGGGGCGDVFGDMVHILRDDTTGQPILAQRWVELPAEITGYGWGYCPIAVYMDEGMQIELPFLPYSCDIDPAFLEYVEEVDYFGRLNGGRTKERNHRMHLDEVISNIKQADVVTIEETGRLKMGFGCVSKTACEDWATVDSPMESMALYVRTMKYGHLATDPYEIDTWAHGDPKLPAQFHPALTEADLEKLVDGGLENLVPNDGKQLDECWDYSQAEWYDDLDGDGFWTPAEPYFDIDHDGEYDDVGPPPEPFTDLNGNGVWDPAEPFTDDNLNGVADEFVFLCADPEELSEADLLDGAVFLGAAANKTGRITVDLVQYLNRFLKITKDTEHTLATINRLPALYRDCWSNPADPDDPVEGEIAVDPAYDLECDIVAADPDLTPRFDLFPDIQEEFVDFAALEKYKRANEKVTVIKDDATPGIWTLSVDEKLRDWVEFVNGAEFDESNVDGFVDASSDTVRSIEFIHNYAQPADLYCQYDPNECL